MTEAPQTERLLYTAPEAAERLRIHRVTLLQKAASGEIGSVSIGRRRFFRSEDLEAFIAANHTPAR